MLTASQARAARAMARMTVQELARRAGVAPYTITRLEAGLTLQPRTLEAVQAVLEQHGVEFIEDGVRMRKPS
jgi:transcriptional regulator with XRE-family HTH domain